MNIDDLSHAERRALLERLLRQKIGASDVDLRAETQLDLVVDGAPMDPGREVRDVFLTGATGFVGAFVLRELLDRSGGRIHCLVRAGSSDEGRRRIEANLRSYGLSEAMPGDRLVPVAGDLTRPRLGLTEEGFTALAGEVDAIYHVAALVNLAQDYRQLKPTNVDGTREVIRLAAARRVKPLHYVSSYAVFDSVRNVGKTFSEADEPMEYRRLSNGYAESKWVAEGLIRSGQAAGLPISIYRVGWVIGDSRTGAWNGTDFIPRLLKAFVEAGKCCDFGTFTMTPVDYVGRAFVYLAARRESLGKVFHLSNGRRYASRQLFAWMAACGYDLQEVPLEEWEAEMRRSSQELSVTPLLLFLEDVAGGLSRMSQWLSNEPDFDVSYTLNELAGGGPVCPEIDHTIMGAYLSDFVARGYIPPANPRVS